MRTLREEQPFASAVSTSFLTKVCSNCFSSTRRLMKCRSCDLMSYCNDDCRAKDFAQHMDECFLVQRGNSAGRSIPCSYTRMASRILLKEEKELSAAAFNERTWDSLEERVAEMKKSQRYHILLGHTEELLAFITPRKKISREEAETALGKIYANVLSHKEDDLGTTGIALFLGLSIHEHSCLPNCHFIFEGANVALRTADPRLEYSSSLTVSYIPRLPFSANRQKTLKETYYFDCQCTLCTDDNHIINRMGASCYVSCCEDGAGILDDEAGLFKCNVCGQGSDITSEQVEAAQNHIHGFSHGRRVKDVCHGLKLLNNYQEILSKYNYRLVDLRGAIARSRYADVALKKKMIDAIAPVYEYYLPDGDPSRADLAVQRAVICEESDGDDLLLQMQKAFEAMKLTHGENHPKMVYFCKYLEERIAPHLPPRTPS